MSYMMHLRACKSSGHLLCCFPLGIKLHYKTSEAHLNVPPDMTFSFLHCFILFVLHLET